MLIQTEDNTVINTDLVLFKPVTRGNGTLDRYVAVTTSLQPVCDVSVREMEVILLLAAQAPEGKPLCTREWGAVNGTLNYRYAQVLAERHDGGYGTEGLMTWLKAKVAAGAAEKATIEESVDMLSILSNLAGDLEFNELTAEGRKTISSLCGQFVASAHSCLSCILERWDDIFIDLPF